MVQLHEVKQYLMKTFYIWQNRFPDNIGKTQGFIGKTAQLAIILLIKIEFIKKYNGELNGNTPERILGMSGNHDEWHELDDLFSDGEMPLDDEHQWLVKAATQLLKYGV